MTSNIIISTYVEEGSAKAVAFRLGRNMKTIQYHLAMAKKRLGLTCYNQLITWAFRSGLVYLLALHCCAMDAKGQNKVTSKLLGVLVVSANPAQGGTTTGSGEYKSRTMVSISESPAPGWTFASWQDGATSPSRTVQVLGGKTITYTASFFAVIPSNSKVNVWCPPVVSAVSYKFNWGVVSGSPTNWVINNTTNAVITGLTPRTVYYFTAQAISSGAQAGPPSCEVAVIPSASGSCP